VSISSMKMIAGGGARQQRLAGPRRPRQQHALRRSRAHAPVLLRVLEVVDDLKDLGLDLVDAPDVVERHPHSLGVDRLLLAAGAEETTTQRLLLPPEDPVVERDQQQDRGEREQQVRQRAALLHHRGGADRGAAVLQFCQQVVLRERGPLRGELPVCLPFHTRHGRGLAQLTLHGVPAGEHLRDVAVLHLRRELAVGHRRRAGHPILGRQQTEHHQIADQHPGEPLPVDPPLQPLPVAVRGGHALGPPGLLRLLVRRLRRRTIPPIGGGCLVVPRRHPARRRRCVCHVSPSVPPSVDTRASRFAPSADITPSG